MILDEVHERHVPTDLLLGLLRALVAPSPAHTTASGLLRVGTPLPL